MENFNFSNRTQIVFGRDVESQTGEYAKKYGSKILLHYGGGSIKRTGLYDKVIKSLSDQNITVVELGGVSPNPTLEMVKKGIKICKDEGIKFILAVGGGSVIDSSKAISAGVMYDGDVWDFFTGDAEIKSTIPVGVVLTIPAAGSESSTGSVITNEDGDLKRAFNTVLAQPVFAIMNPLVTYTLPARQVAAGGTDIMAHVMERYFTNSAGVDFTDMLCEATIKTIINNIPKALVDPENYDVRANIMWAGTIAHNGLLGTGRIEDWGSHMVEHEISGIYGVTHGAGLAIIIPAWMKYVYKHDVPRFVRFAREVFGISGDGETAALAGIQALEDFYTSIGMPTRLSQLDIGTDRFSEMAEKCCKDGTVGNFIKLGGKDVLNIYNLAK